MKPDEIDLIKNKICPLIAAGEASLLLGAGFSYKNPTETGEIPTGEGLKHVLLNECGRVAGPTTTLKDAYTFASRKITAFPEYLRACFTVTKVHPWQSKIFQYVWSRIYTTNIDNVLNVAYEYTRATRKAGAEYSFLNYSDMGILGQSIGTVPVVTIHGTINHLDQGFIFSNGEYGIASSRKVLDWHNELAARMLIGGLIVIGNQLDESDFDTHLAAREREYGVSEESGRNWIVMPNPDEIKKENYIAAGYDVIDATAEEFFEIVFSNLRPRNIGEIISEDVPAARKHSLNQKAMVWFKEAFNPVVQEIEHVSSSGGILRHFITGAHPTWFYIENDAHAETPKIAELTKRIADLMTGGTDEYGILHVTGPSGSGKTTGIRAALRHLVSVYPYIYEYDSDRGIDIDYLHAIIQGFSEKSIFVFYSAAAFYYTVNALAVRLSDERRPFVLFILEDRTNSYRKNLHHLNDCVHMASQYEFGRASLDDAKAIARKIDAHGLKFPNFSEYSLEKQARTILDFERGYRGDLLSALFSLTTHENFEEKIFKEYQSISDDDAKSCLDHVAIVNSLGFSVPINFLAGFLEFDQKKVFDYLNRDLVDILVPLPPKQYISCRHRVIADFYFKNCIAGNGRVELIVGMLEFLSRQFTIADIIYHPLAYEIYKKVISFNFLYDDFFPKSSRRKDAERTYHEAQRFFGKDGVFWLQFGRFYRKIGELDNAIDCFRTGLGYYDSFQTRHSLGTVLLEKYIKGGAFEEELFDEGIELLDAEKVRRGTLDAYPTTTLCTLLLKVTKIRPDDKKVAGQLREYMNYGIKYFKSDPAFSQLLRRFYQRA